MDFTAYVHIQQQSSRVEGKLQRYKFHRQMMIFHLTYYTTTTTTTTTKKTQRERERKREKWHSLSLRHLAGCFRPQASDPPGPKKNMNQKKSDQWYNQIQRMGVGRGGGGGGGGGGKAIWNLSTDFPIGILRSFIRNKSQHPAASTSLSSKRIRRNNNNNNNNNIFISILFYIPSWWRADKRRRQSSHQTHTHTHTHTHTQDAP